MGTYALIALIKDDESVLATCINSDGYVSFTGPKLLEMYTNEADVEKLVNQGEWGRLVSPQQLDGKLVNPILKNSLPDFPQPPNSDGFIHGFQHVYIYKNNEWFYREISEDSKLTNVVKETLAFEQNQNDLLINNGADTNDLADALEALLNNPNSSLYQNVATQVLTRHRRKPK